MKVKMSIARGVSLANKNRFSNPAVQPISLAQGHLSTDKDAPLVTKSSTL